MRGWDVLVRSPLADEAVPVHSLCVQTIGDGIQSIPYRMRGISRPCEPWQSTACRLWIMPNGFERFAPNSRRREIRNGSHFSKNLEKCFVNMIVGLGP